MIDMLRMLRAAGVLGRTVGMVAAALALLLVLGFADPGNRRLMPSFFSANPLPGVMPRGSVDEAALLRTIGQYNDAAANAYRTSDPSALAEVPMSAELRDRIAEEIAFLQREGRRLEIAVRDVRIREVRRLENQMLSVDTRETVRLRELDATGARAIAVPHEAPYAMNYLLERAGTAWRVVTFETLSAGGRDE